MEHLQLHRRFFTWLKLISIAWFTFSLYLAANSQYSLSLLCETCCENNLRNPSYPFLERFGRGRLLLNKGTFISCGNSADLISCGVGMKRILVVSVKYTGSSWMSAYVASMCLHYDRKSIQLQMSQALKFDSNSVWDHWGRWAKLDSALLEEAHWVLFLN